jgi:hypothetical protein
MKFQLKAITAAVILAASIPAQAAMAPGSSGNSSFVLTVFDTSANVQASFDLGRNYLDFNQVAAAGAVSNVTDLGTTFSWNLASNPDYASAWTPFIAAATSPNIRWAVSAVDNASAGTGTGFRGYITTRSAAAATNMTNQQLLNALGPFDTFVNNENFFGHTADNGSLFTASASTASTLYGIGNNTNRLGGSTAGPIALVSGLNSSALVEQRTTSSGAGPVANTATLFANGASFTLSSNGVLTYATAPIPEADTWAMMLLGLGFMGFVARRKQA